MPGLSRLRSLKRCWQALRARALQAQSRVHAKPKPLAKDAVTHDWPSFLGPSHNGVSTETRLSPRFHRR